MVPRDPSQLMRDWIDAAMMFGRLSPLDIEICMALARVTWLAEPMAVSAPMGVADFAARLPPTRTRDAIRDRLGMLIAKGADGFGMIDVVRPATHSAPRVLALQEDWRAWSWTELGRRVADDRLGPNGRPPAAPGHPQPAPRTWTSDAQRVAVLLREHVKRIDPTCTPPDPLKPDAEWDDWCRATQKLIDRVGTVDHALGVVQWVHGDDFWRSVIVGSSAHKRLNKHLDQILVQRKQRPTHTGGSWQ